MAAHEPVVHATEIIRLLQNILGNDHVGVDDVLSLHEFRCALVIRVRLVAGVHRRDDRRRIDDQSGSDHCSGGLRGPAGQQRYVPPRRPGLQPDRGPLRQAHGPHGGQRGVSIAIRRQRDEEVRIRHEHAALERELLQRGAHDQEDPRRWQQSVDTDGHRPARHHPAHHRERGRRAAVKVVEDDHGAVGARSK